MARFYTEISKKEFLDRIKELMSDDDEGELWCYKEFSTSQKWIKDLRKVNFDFENCTDFDTTEGFATYPVGYEELKSGFHVFFVNAGGDWEFPICFIFYWGENELRAYIPKCGNAWNRKEKSAYGNHEDDPFDPSDEVNEVDIKEDILYRIIKK